jgi:hypothetical protein
MRYEGTCCGIEGKLFEPGTLAKQVMKTDGRVVMWESVLTPTSLPAKPSPAPRALSLIERLARKKLDLTKL